jgi:hypothetical protein
VKPYEEAEERKKPMCRRTHREMVNAVTIGGGLEEEMVVIEVGMTPVMKELRCRRRVEAGGGSEKGGRGREG